jgi:hypothetical protein
LLLAFAVPKANRDIRVLWILVPLAIVNLLWWLFLRFAGMNPSDTQEFTLIFHSMAAGVTVLWLIANYVVRLGGALRFLLSFVTVVAVAGLGPLYYAEFSSETVLFLALFILLALTMLAAVTLSRRLCGRKYRPVCFMLWLALWTLLGGLFATLGLLIVGSIIMSSGPDLAEAIMTLAVAGSIIGLCLYVLNLPFMILGFANAFFRERFCACLGLKSMPCGLASQTQTGGNAEVASFKEEN